MSENEITISRIPIKDLPVYIREFLRGKPDGTFIPITVQRADAQAKNPLVKPNDVGLLVAEDSEEVVGFLGMVPQCLKYPGGQSIAWYFSAWNVSRKVAGKGVGRQLLHEAFKLKQDFFLAGSKYARAAVMKAGMTPITVWDYTVIDLNRPLEYNPVTLLLRTIRKVLGLIGIKVKFQHQMNRANEFFTKLLGYPTRKLIYRKILKDYDDLISDIDVVPVDNVRLEDRNKNIKIPEVTFYRSPKLINWTLNNPWVLAPGESTTENMEYYFTDVLIDFNHQAYEIFYREKYQGEIVISSAVKGGKKTAKITDTLLEDQKIFLPAIMKILSRMDVERIDLNTHQITDFLKSRIGKLLSIKKEKEYHYFVHDDESPLKKYAEQIVFDVSDGDMANT